MTLPINQVICGECAAVMATFPDACIDLTVTSPPYDNLRAYHGYTFDFPAIAQQLYRITKPGGVVVWIVGDATIKGSETGTSFRQALCFKEIGFNLHDTMIWNKGGFTATGSLAVRYAPVFEYMFIASKDNVKTFNPIKDRKNKHTKGLFSKNQRDVNGSIKTSGHKGIRREHGQRFNIWSIFPYTHNNQHPAPFPAALAHDHILSWSNPGDLVLDPMCGSGTTCEQAKKLGRDYIGIEISAEYCELARRIIA